MALVGLITFTTAAICPAALATKLYSPSPRHAADAARQNGNVVSPFAYLGSKAHAAPGASARARVNRWVVPPPRAAKATAGTLALALTFATTLGGAVSA